MRHGVTTHGLAVNVDNDLQPFEWIVPCGIDGCRMTSLARETGEATGVQAFGETLAEHFEVVFERRIRSVEPREAVGLVPGAETLLADPTGALP